MRVCHEKSGLVRGQTEALGTRRESQPGRKNRHHAAWQTRRGFGRRPAGNQSARGVRWHGGNSKARPAEKGHHVEALDRGRAFVKHIVLDASVSLGWFVDDPVPPYSVRVKESLLGGGRAVVPALWHLQMANGLVMAERRGILSTIDTEGALVRVEQFLTQVIETETDLFSVRQTFTSARSFSPSAYDAA